MRKTAKRRPVKKSKKKPNQAAEALQNWWTTAGRVAAIVQMIWTIYKQMN